MHHRSPRRKLATDVVYLSVHGNAGIDLVSAQNIAKNTLDAADQSRTELAYLCTHTAAGQVISRSVDTNDNRRLVEEFVNASEAKVQ